MALLECSMGSTVRHLPYVEVSFVKCTLSLESGGEKEKGT